MILLIDTTTDYLGLGIWDGKKLHTKTIKANNNTNKKIISIIDKFGSDKLKIKNWKLKISALGVVNGPGSFTGVRTGITIANAISYALDVPIYSVNSLAAQALGVDSDEVVSILSAAKEDVYYLRFSGKVVKSDIKVVNISKINKDLAKNFEIVGQLREEQKKILNIKILDIKPKKRIENLLQMIIDNKIKPQKQIKPLYIKKPNITIKKSKNHLSN